MRKLQRKLSIWPIIAISIAGMLGTGIFVLPGPAAEMMGNQDHLLWLAYLLAAILILPSVVSKSELATAMPQSGGTMFTLKELWSFIWNNLRYWTLGIFNS